MVVTIIIFFFSQTNNHFPFFYCQSTRKTHSSRSKYDHRKSRSLSSSEDDRVSFVCLNLLMCYLLLNLINFRTREKVIIVEDVVLIIKKAEIDLKVVIEIENNMKVEVSTEEADL